MLTTAIVVPATLAGGAVAVAVHSLGRATRAPARSRLRTDLGSVRPERRPVVALPAAVSSSLERAGVTSSDHATVIAAWLGCVAACVLAIPFVPGAAVAAVVAAIGPPGVVIAMRGRAAQRRRHHLPAVLETVASGLRSGRSLHLALDDASSSAGPLGPELAELSRQVRGGRSLVEVVDEWSGADPDTRLTGAAIATAAAVGGPGAQTLLAAAASLRERADADAAVDALSVQARLSAIVLTAAPVAFTVLLTVLDPQAADFLLRTPIGWLCIAVGVVLDALGAWWMSRLVGQAR